MATVPHRFADTWRLRDATLAVIRPAAPDDADAIQALVRGLSPTSRYLRFFNGVQELSPEWLVRFSRAAPESEVTLLATAVHEGKEIAVGMAQYAADPFPSAASSPSWWAMHGRAWGSEDGCCATSNASRGLRASSASRARS